MTKPNRQPDNSADQNETPVLRCPACGERSLLATGQIMVEVLDVPGVCGRPYGHPETVPLNKKQKAVCNRSACRWEGRIGDARETVHATRAAADALRATYEPGGSRSFEGRE